MNSISFVKPNYPGEKRVAILPSDIKAVKDHIVFEEIFIERGFGSHLNISDAEYINAGCTIVSRQDCFAQPQLFSLKLIQPDDYEYLQRRQKIIGWMHPNGSGRDFFVNVAKKLEISIFDIDSIYPRIYRSDGNIDSIKGLPQQFFWKNSYIAGIAATKLAIDYLKVNLDNLNSIAVLGTGSVSQGAFSYLSKLDLEPRMFYRKTLPLFYEHLNEYDLIVNGIEMDNDNGHILDREKIEQLRHDVIIIDAAADAGRAIEGTNYLSLENPLGYAYGRKYTLVNNAPTLMYEKASKEISKVVSKIFLTKIFF